MTELRTVFIGKSPDGNWANLLSGVGVALTYIENASRLDEIVSELRPILFLADLSNPTFLLRKVAKLAAESKNSHRIFVVALLGPSDVEIGETDFDRLYRFGVHDFLKPETSPLEISERVRFLSRTLMRTWSYSQDLSSLVAQEKERTTVQPVPKGGGGGDEVGDWTGIREHMTHVGATPPQNENGRPYRYPAVLLILAVDQYNRIGAAFSREDLHKLRNMIRSRFDLAIQRHCQRRSTPFATDAIQILQPQQDEFAFLVSGIDQLETATNFGRELVREFTGAIGVNGQRLHVTASIGIAVMSESVVDPDSVISQAHSALSHAKEIAGNSMQFYSAERDASALSRLELEAFLKEGITENQFELVYQPQIDLPGRRVSGVEALARWHHPKLGFVSPSAFISVAEDAGMGEEIGLFALRAAMSQGAEWLRAGMSRTRISVNITADMFRRSGLVETVLDSLGETGFDPNWLTLELTESMILDETQLAIDTMNRLRSAGVRFALDDFGTGYSSLSYLKNLPFDYLKIDRSFVSEIGENSDNRTVIHAIIAMAKTLDMAIIAEGVETRQQLDWLVLEGCDAYQGYLFSQPVPGSKIPEFVKFFNQSMADGGLEFLE